MSPSVCQSPCVTHTHALTRENLFLSVYDRQKHAYLTPGFCSEHWYYLHELIR
jgi:hypothetical protein